MKTYHIEVIFNDGSKLEVDSADNFECDENLAFIKEGDCYYHIPMENVRFIETSIQ